MKHVKMQDVVNKELKAYSVSEYALTVEIVHEFYSN